MLKSNIIQHYLLLTSIRISGVLKLEDIFFLHSSVNSDNVHNVESVWDQVCQSVDPVYCRFL